jgi:hypothetical protein
MSRKIKELTYDQAKELEWFCKNVAGVRVDMYAAIEAANSFDERIKRLEKTCVLIEKFLKESDEDSKTEMKQILK